MVTIREATLEDLDTIAQNNIALAWESESLHLAPAVISQGVLRILEGHPSTGGALYYMAVVDDSVVGQLMITKEWSDWRCNQVFWVQSVYVQPTFRKQGVFKQLYAHARAEALRAGAAGLRLYADVLNETAHMAVSLMLCCDQEDLLLATGDAVRVVHALPYLIGSRLPSLQLEVRALGHDEPLQGKSSEVRSLSLQRSTRTETRTDISFQ